MHSYKVSVPSLSKASKAQDRAPLGWPSSQGYSCLPEPKSIGVCNPVSGNQRCWDKWSLQSITYADRCSQCKWDHGLETREVSLWRLPPPPSSNPSIALWFLIRRKMWTCITSDLFRYRLYVYTWCLKPQGFGLNTLDESKRHLFRSSLHISLFQLISLLWKVKTLTFGHTFLGNLIKAGWSESL